MMRWLLLIGSLWLGHLDGAWAQVKLEPTVPRRIEIGIDLLKTPLALIGIPKSNYLAKNEPFSTGSFLTIEPIIRLESQNRRRYWQGQVGFTQYTNAPFRNANLTMTGGFLKIGSEWSMHSDVARLAILLTASTWQTGGEVRLPAGTFAPYATPIPTTTGGAVGLELQTNRDFRLGDRWLLRLLVRYDVFLHSTSSQTIIPKYLPGLGLYRSPSSDINSPVGTTIGLNLQLFYTFRSD